MPQTALVCCAALLSMLAAPAMTQEGGRPAARIALFGDLHLHTGNSFDAASVGVTMTRDDAYRYARGEAVDYLGRAVRRNTPLDFLAVTDHAEYMGVVPDLIDPAGPFPDLHELLMAQGGPVTGLGNREGLMGQIQVSGFNPAPPVPQLVTEQVKARQWRAVVADAEKYYAPGTFTTFAAYEWSPMLDGAHQHRNVIFAGPDYPDAAFSSIDSPRPADLYAYADANRAAGIDSVLIPHNPNLSGGLMFADRGEDGGPMSREFAEMRARNEVLAEITQVKGTSETHPDLSPDDRFADFEILEHFANGVRRPLEGSYVRDAFRTGLEIAARTGVNPFAFGVVGATDSHTALSNTEEDNYVGSLGPDDGPDRADSLLNQINPVLNAPSAIVSAGGLTGVWAEDNTREAIFAALKRREAFATSGPRIQVRLFASFAYADGLTEQADWVERAYRSGVAMGGDLAAAGAGQAPHFLLDAAKDPNGANLDRVQIVKIWHDGAQSRERVYDVLWSGGRRPDADGLVGPVGDTVDSGTATYTNEIGAARLTGEWTDPDFDPSRPALYYARVIEIPTPRWSTYLAAANGMDPPGTLPVSIQERAWTSPVFYTP